MPPEILHKFVLHVWFLQVGGVVVCKVFGRESTYTKVSEILDGHTGGDNKESLYNLKPR